MFVSAIAGYSTGWSSVIEDLLAELNGLGSVDEVADPESG